MTSISDRLPGAGLQLTRLRVEQFRRFRQPVELDGLSPGLNLFSGPNEAGKSSLVRAIRAAFFERHRSTAVDDLRPWGDSSASPAVEIDFLLDGHLGRLQKSFLGKKRCHLQIDARVLEGVEAEDHLAGLFGFAFAGKGVSKPEHWGIPGLLWVEQGSGQLLDVSHAREHLHDALAGSSGGADPAAAAATGALAATGGDDILAQLRDWRGQLLTGGGKARGPLADALAELGTLSQSLLDLQAQAEQYRQQVDQLALWREQHQAEALARPWQALRVELQQVQLRQQALLASQQQLSADQVRLAQLEQTRQWLLAQLQLQAQQEQAAAVRRRALAEATDQLTEATAALARARLPAEAGQLRAQAARETLRRVRVQANRSSLQAQLDGQQAVAGELQQALQRAESEHQRLMALRQAAAAASINRADLDALRQLARRLGETRLQRQAVATRLRFELQPGAGLSLQTAAGEQALSGQGECLLDAPASLILPGIGELTISPGGADLQRLAAAQQDAEDALAAALQRLGLADLAAAEARWLAQAEAQAQIQLAEQALAIVAPKGLDALRTLGQQALARLADLQRALAQLSPQLPPPGPHPAPAGPDAEADDGSPISLDQAEALQLQAEQAAQEAAAALAQAQRQQATAQDRQAQAAREAAAADAALADPTRQQRHAEAQQQLLEQGAERDALASRADQLTDALRQARPDIVAQDIERLSRSAEQREQAHQQRREQILLLENSLQLAGAQGLDEQCEAAAGALARARQRADQLQQRSAALALLCERLDSRRQATLTQLQAPLQLRLQHYLPLLLPGARLQLGDDLAPASLSRVGAGGHAETGQVEQLSFGAREQLGLISRFAYADLLRSAGRPTLIMLDDALVHSDALRLGQMKRVIFDAAQRHQILLFTCHPEQWQDMGVVVRALPG